MLTFFSEPGNVPTLIKSCSLGESTTYYWEMEEYKDCLPTLCLSIPLSLSDSLCFISLGDEDIDQI